MVLVDDITLDNMCVNRTCRGSVQPITRSNPGSYGGDRPQHCSTGQYDCNVCKEELVAYSRCLYVTQTDRRNFSRRKTYVKGINSLFQADMQQLTK